MRYIKYRKKTIPLIRERPKSADVFLRSIIKLMQNQLVVPAICRWCHAQFLAKKPSEIIRREADFICYFFN